MRAFLQASASSFLASNSTLFLCGPDLLLRPLYFSDWSLVDLKSETKLAVSGMLHSVYWDHGINLTRDGSQMMLLNFACPLKFCNRDTTFNYFIQNQPLILGRLSIILF